MRISDWSSDVCSSDLDVGNVLRCFGEPRGDLAPLAFELSHARFHDRLIQPVLDRRHDAPDRLVDLGERPPIGIGLNAPLSVLAVDMVRICRNRRLDLVGRHQPLGYARERPALQRLAPDRPVIDAGTAAMMAYASIAIANDDSISSATGAAFEQTRAQIRSEERRLGYEGGSNVRFR